MGVGGGYYPDTKITDLGGDYLGIFADGGILTHTVPENYKFYFHTIYDTPGVVAANTFISVFNPGGSGKNVVFFQAEIGSYAVGTTTVPTSLLANRISAASGGTQIAAANVNRFVTSWPDPAAEVRVGGPTTTKVGLPLNAWIPPLATGVGAAATAYTSTPPGAGFFCAPGEGLSFSTSAGDVDQMWKINVIWAEF